ncbi:hypothetical protein CPT03_21955 [Pedobacter ginsengisoli]|uniref:Uncharacterized protein n=1 Tax=Pedobacter ginsengisoli TaxID=363852 RepID=A0A2D1UBD4_9SPHI|nr:hypothetical protein [Pedobacter ginsengisoli]ATP58942.1 hypothetical protein CPT03_21955 [Pedobacter ginsengisoli]
MQLLSIAIPLLTLDNLLQLNIFTTEWASTTPFKQIAMYETTLNPDFNKLKDYSPNITDADITKVQEAGGVPVNLEYMREARYLTVSEGLKTVVETYGIADHYEELLYLILQKNEQIRVRYDAYWQNYNDDLTSREVAKFLLAYKESKPNQHFQLVAKPLTGSVAIKDTAIAKWMCELIYKAIEARDFPLDVFGEKLFYDLFGDNFASGNPISLDRLKATAQLSPRKPTVRVKRLLVEFCLYIQVYLIKHTNLTTPSDVLLTDAQVNFFFDVLELLGYLDRDDIESEPKDYIHTMIRNHIK